MRHSVEEKGGVNERKRNQAFKVHGGRRFNARDPDRRTEVLRMGIDGLYSSLDPEFSKGG
jgi:hypothetical protein